MLLLDQHGPFRFFLCFSCARRPRSHHEQTTVLFTTSSQFVKMVQMSFTIAMLMGGATCATAFTGPLGATSFGGARIVERSDAVAPARRSVVTPTMGGKENAIRCALAGSSVNHSFYPRRPSLFARGIRCHDFEPEEELHSPRVEDWVMRDSSSRIMDTNSVYFPPNSEGTHAFRPLYQIFAPHEEIYQLDFRTFGPLRCN